ncbi:MAG: glycosyltransferase family 4 protein, partial [Gammaproteobacteria bacterium]
VRWIGGGTEVRPQDEEALLDAGHDDHAAAEERVHAPRADELGITPRTRWTGWRNDLSPFYQSASVFVSAARHEPFGNVILEAWAHGVPVVATRTLGAQELIEDETSGLLAPCAQPEKLAQVILHALEQDDAARRALAGRGLQNIRAAYSREAIVNAYLALYQRLAGEG